MSKTRSRSFRSIFSRESSNLKTKNAKRQPSAFRLSVILVSATLALMPGHLVMAQAVPSGNLQSSEAPPPSNTNPMPPVAGPSVPSASSILTPELLTSLAPVLNPQQMIIDVSTLATPGVMSFSGNWTNTDNLVLISTNSAVQTATISAANIFLPVGTSVSTVIPAGFSNAIQNLNLSLIAQNAIFNAGQIVAAGNLSMSAPVIANVAPATVSPALASTGSSISSLAGNVSMLANTIINQSTIAAAMGNINIASLTNSLAINNIGGTLSAANLNIGTQGLPGSLSIDILGGDFISNLLNIETGNAGTLNMAAGSISGQVNLSSGLFASIQATNGALNIGNMFSDGDPFITTEDGDVVFSGNTSSAFVNVNASRNILADFSSGAVSINAQSLIGLNAGQSVLLDGVTMTTTNGSIALEAGTGSVSVNGSTITAGGTGAVLISAPSGGILAENTQLTSGGFADLEASSMFIPGLQITSEGATLKATSGSINGAGTAESAVPTFNTGSQSFVAIADTGSITIPGAQITTGGGNVLMFAGGNLDLSYDAVSYQGPAALINTSKEEAAGGYVFLGSKGGSVNTGAESLITVGELAPPSQNFGNVTVYPIAIAAFNGVKVGDVTSPGGDLIIGSGFETTGSNGNYLFHIRDVNQGDPQGFHRGHGSGGVSTGNINIRLAGEGKASIYVESSNGAARFGSVTGDGREISLSTSEKVNDMSIDGDVTNVNVGNNNLAPNIFISSRRGLELGGNILNDNKAGTGGVVGITCAESDGIVLGAGGITITNNSTGNGGFTGVTNSSYMLLDGSGDTIEGGSISYNTGGIVNNSNGAGAHIGLVADSLQITGSLDASANSSDSAGGSVNLEGAFSANFDGAQISANGSGTGSGGQITIRGETLSGAGATVNANSETGYGGEILLGGQLSAGNLSLNANGGAEGAGGTISLSAFELNLQSGNLEATAQGGLAGGRFVAETESNLSIDSKVFNVAPFEGSNGNGGSLWLRSLSGDLTTIGNLNVDGEGTGSGGEMFLSSGGGDFAIGEGGSKLFARSGTEGGDGGRIFVSAGKNLTIASDAVLNAHVRGEQGNGGLIELTGGLLEPGGVTIDSNIQVNGKGTGSGGFIIVNAADFGGTESEGAKIVINGNLTANAGNEATGGGGGGGGVGTLALSALDSGAGGSISINLFGDGQNEPGTSYIEVNGNLRADGGKNAAGGFISIAASGAGNDITVGSTSLLSAQGGTESGAGGQVFISSASAITLDAAVNASARGTGDGGTIAVESYSELGSKIQIHKDLRADASGTGFGGSVSITGYGGDSEVSLSPASTGIFARGGNAEGSGGSILLHSEGNLSLSGNNLDASARGIGDGGRIEVFGNSTEISISGNYAADGGTVGKGGSIEIRNTLGDLSIGDPLSANNRITVRGGTQSGDGNSVIISSAGSLTVDRTEINAGAANLGKGGAVEITSGFGGSGDLNFNGGIFADGEGDGGDGGQISITAISGNAVFNHPAQNAEVLSVQGGALADTGNGGVIDIVAFGDLQLNSGRVHASSLAKSGSGGAISLRAGTGGEGALSYNFDITANGGIETGNGGEITLTQSSASIMNVSGKIIANSSDASPAGQITLQNKGISDFNLVIDDKHKADGVGAYTITQDNPNGNILIDVRGTVVISDSKAYGDFSVHNGKNITIFSSNGLGTINGAIDITGESLEITLDTPISIQLARVLPGNGKLSISTPHLSVIGEISSDAKGGIEISNSSNLILSGSGQIEGKSITLTSGKFLDIRDSLSVTARNSDAELGTTSISLNAGADLKIGPDVVIQSVGDESHVSGSIYASAGLTGEGRVLVFGKVETVREELSGLISLQYNSNELLEIDGSLKTASNNVQLTNVAGDTKVRLTSQSTIIAEKFVLFASHQDGARHNLELEIRTGSVFEADLETGPVDHLSVSAYGNDRELAVSSVDAVSASFHLTQSKDSKTQPVSSSMIIRDKIEVIEQLSIFGAAKLDIPSGSKLLGSQENSTIELETKQLNNNGTILSYGTILARHGNRAPYLEITGDGQIRGHLIAMSFDELFILGNQQLISEGNSMTISSTVQLRGDTLVVRAGATLEIGTAGGNFNSSRISAKEIVNNGEIKSRVALFQLAPNNQHLSLSGSGMWTVPELNLISATGIITNVTGNLGSVRHPDFQFAPSTPVVLSMGIGEVPHNFKNIDLSIGHGNITLEFLSVARDLSLSINSLDTASKVTLHGSIFAGRDLSIHVAAPSGSIELDQSAALRSGRNLSLSIGPVNQSLFSSIPPANYGLQLISGTLGPLGNVLISPKLIQVLAPSTLESKAFMTLYDGGSLANQQIIFGGGNTLQAGLIPQGLNSEKTELQLKTLSVLRSELSFLSLPRLFRSYQSILLEEGELIIRTKEKLQLLTAAGAKFEIKEGTCAYVLCHKEGLIIRNIADHSIDSMVVFTQLHGPSINLQSPCVTTGAELVRSNSALTLIQ